LAGTNTETGLALVGGKAQDTRYSSIEIVHLLSHVAWTMVAFDHDGIGTDVMDRYPTLAAPWS
jgi:hypothetical protein